MNTDRRLGMVRRTRPVVTSLRWRVSSLARARRVGSVGAGARSLWLMTQAVEVMPLRSYQALSMRAINWRTASAASRTLPTWKAVSSARAR